MQVGSVDITPNVNNLLVTIDGILQHEADAYTISGSTITFTSAPATGASAYIVLMGQSASVGQGTVGADELKVSGNGSTGQVLTSDGDGTFSWATDTEDYLTIANNLSDLNNTGTARTNIGLGNVTNESKATMFTSPTFTGNLTSTGIDDNATSTAVTLNSSGNVGIGTDSPDAKLEVASGQAKTVTSGVEFARFGTSNEASNYATLNCEMKGGASAADRKWIFQTIESGVANAGNIAFQPDGGNVGIGTTSPTLGKLQVAGGGYFGPVGTGDATTKAEMQSNAVLRLKPHDTNSTNMNFASVNGGAGIGIQTTNGPGTANWDIALSPFGGNVGIGTTSPSYKLEVNGGTALVGGGFYVSSDQSIITTSAYTFRDAVYINNPNSTSAAVSSNSVMSIGASSGNSVITSLITTGAVGIGTTSPAKKLDVAGEITHEGLVPKAGAFVDGLVTINKTVSISANTWTSLDISLSNIGGTGTFAVQVYSDAHGSTGGAWYNMYWSGIMSWYHNGTNDDDIDEIPLHMAGHARNNNTLELRTKLHTADGSSYANRCELQIKTANALSSAPISFRFRKLL